MSDTVNLYGIDYIYSWCNVFFLNWLNYGVGILLYYYCLFT